MDTLTTFWLFSKGKLYFGKALFPTKDPIYAFKVCAGEIFRDNDTPSTFRLLDP